MNDNTIIRLIRPENGKRLVKRVIGLPGDTITMRDNRLFINAKSVEYNQLQPKMMSQFDSELKNSHIFFTEQLIEKKSYSNVFTIPTIFNFIWAGNYSKR